MNQALSRDRPAFLTHPPKRDFLSNTLLAVFGWILLGAGNHVLGQSPPTLRYTPSVTTLVYGQELRDAMVLADVSALAGGNTGTNNGTGTNAGFYNPTGLSMDPAQTNVLFVADQLNHVIRRITISNSEVTTLAGTMSTVNTPFRQPFGLAVSSDTLLVADTANHSIRRVRTNDGSVTLEAGGGSQMDNGITDDPPRFSYPRGIAVGSAGIAYVSDYEGGRIRRLNSGTVTTIAGGGSGFAEGIGTNAKFYEPQGLVLDATGNLYVADAANHRIRKITSPWGGSPAVTTFAGGGGSLERGGGFVNGTGTNAAFNYPAGVAMDAFGNLYVADQFNNRIRMVGSNGVVTTLAGGSTNNSDGFVNDTGTNALFRSPTGLAVDSSNNLIYVADAANHAIRTIRPPYSTPGQWAWASPDTILEVGSHSRSATFTPTRTNFSAATTQLDVRVIKALPVILTNPTAAPILYGQALSNAVITNPGRVNNPFVRGGSSNVPGRWDWVSPTNRLSAGTHSPAIVFTATQSNNYEPVANNISLVVNRATPVITWRDPAAITYGTPLATNQQLNAIARGASNTLLATSPVAGTFQYLNSGGETIGPGALIPAGTNFLRVVFRAEDTANFESPRTNTVTLIVNKATPLFSSLPTAAAITFGQALNNSMFSGGSNGVEGSWVWQTPTNIPNAGTNNLQMVFRPTDTNNYNPVTNNISLVISKATPLLSSLPTAAAITFGQALSNSVLSGGSNGVVGRWAWETPTNRPAVGTNAFNVIFTPSNTANFNAVMTNVSLVVNPATPVIRTLPTAAAIMFGQALSNSVLSGGAASVAGSWAWATGSIAPMAGTTNRYNVIFTPSNTANFSPVTTNVVPVVNKVTPVISESNLPTAGAITFGQALSSSGLSGGNNSVAGSWAWVTPTNRPNAGTNSAAVRFTPTDGTNYSVVTTNVGVEVARAVPAITWSNPSAILYGTALSAAQLNARTAVNGLTGTFAYRPVPGTVLPAGTHTLTAVFSTTNSNYLSPTTNTVSLRVDLPAPVIRALPAAASLTFGQALSNSVLSGGLAGREATVMSLAGGTTSGYADGISTNALFNNPYGVAVDGSGNVYVADTYNHRIRKVSPAGDVTTLAGNGTNGFADNPNGLFAQFNYPVGVAVDTAGNLYVADSLNHRIRKVETNGAVTTLAGSGEAGFSGGGFADGPGTNALFFGPSGVAIGASGTVFVADAGNHRIRKVDTNGEVTTLAGGTTNGYADGSGTNALFNNPYGVAVDASGNVYVADSSNHRIRKVDTNGEVTTLAGGITEGTNNGTATDARFRNPQGVAVDALGNAYVADKGNHGIRKVETNGVVTTLAGAGTSGFANGNGTNARFSSPAGLTVDASGNIYVADAGNHRIRMIVPDRQVSGTWTWTTPAQVPDAGVRTSSVTFTPTDLVNFRVLTSNVTVTVAKATPVISNLPTAAPIAFGQALSNSVLSGGSNGVVGRWAWETPTNRPAGGTSAFNVIFTPSNTTNFNAVMTNVSLVVNRATPAISTLPTAAAITFGQALSNSVLSGGSNSVAGSWAWANGSITPIAGTTNRYSMVFTPSNTANFSPVTTNVVLVVNKAAPSIMWSNPEAITFGTTLSGTQLNATNPVAGTYSYLPTNGSVLSAGTNNLVLTFRPTDSNNYVSPVTRTNPLVVNRATPAISTLPTAAAITFGQALSNSVLSGGSNSVAGSWAWETPANRPAVGTSAFNVIFTPSNPANFNAVTTNVSLVVNPARPVLSNLPTAAAITFGQALSNSVLSGGSNGVAGSWAWATGSITPNASLTNRYSVVFTPSNTANFSPVTTNVVLAVNKAVPQISWSPAAITVGSALSSVQLNATSTVAGTYAYTPTNGAVMSSVGSTNLRVVFTTTNSNYVSPVTNTVSLTVNPVVLANSAPVASGAATLAAIPGGLEIYVLRGERVGNLFLNNFSDAADATRTNGLFVVRGDWTYPGKTAGNLRNGDTIGSAFAAWKTNGSVVTWGDTNSGGGSSGVGSSLSNGVVEIFSGGSAFAALRTNGAVVTWGGANFGGNSSAVSNSLAGGVAGVFSTRSAFAALKTTGSVVTWGATGFGGDSSGVSSSLASGVAVIFSTDSAFAALKTNGSVVAWGDSFAGGDPGFSADGLTNGVVRIYATAAAFAALKGDGSVVSWGSGDSGGDSGSASVGEGVVEIFSARSAFAALKTNGSVVTWGSPNQGGEPSVVPPGGMGDPISVADSLTSGVAEIFSTDTAFAALKEDGSVVTWGSGSDGGDSSTIAASLTSGVAQIFATKTAFAALKEDGSVVTWGQGANGGDSSAVAENLVEGVVTVVAADYAFAALKTNGSVVTWGDSTFGGDSSGVSNSLTGGVKEIFSAAGGFAAVKTNGSVVTWGDSNSFGGGGLVNSSLTNGVLTLATPVQRIRLVRGDALAGVAVVSNAANAGQGTWQYSSGGGIWSNVPANLSASSALVLQNSTRLCFAPASNFTGTPGALTVRLIETGDAPLVTGSSTNAASFSGGTNRISTNSVQLSTQVR